MGLTALQVVNSKPAKLLTVAYTTELCDTEISPFYNFETDPCQDSLTSQSPCVAR